MSNGWQMPGQAPRCGGDRDGQTDERRCVRSPRYEFQARNLRIPSLKAFGDLILLPNPVQEPSGSRCDTVAAQAPQSLRTTADSSVHLSGMETTARSPVARGMREDRPWAALGPPSCRRRPRPRGRRGWGSGGRGWPRQPGAVQRCRSLPEMPHRAGRGGRPGRRVQSTAPSQRSGASFLRPVDNRALWDPVSGGLGVRRARHGRRRGRSRLGLAVVPERSRRSRWRGRRGSGRRCLRRGRRVR